MRELGNDARALDRDAWSSLPSALAGATGIIHVASVVHRPDTAPEEYTRFNVEGTRRWVDKMKALAMKYVYIEVPGGEHSDVIERNPENMRKIFDFFDKARKTRAGG